MAELYTDDSSDYPTVIMKGVINCIPIFAINKENGNLLKSFHLSGFDLSVTCNEASRSMIKYMNPLEVESSDERLNIWLKDTKNYYTFMVGPSADTIAAEKYKANAFYTTPKGPVDICYDSSDPWKVTIYVDDKLISTINIEKPS